jgi:hypothetical protein
LRGIAIASGGLRHSQVDGSQVDASLAPSVRSQTQCGKRASRQTPPGVT